MYIDLLIRLKNAQAARKKFIKFSPFNKLDKAICEILMKNNFITKFELKGKSPKNYLEIYLNPKKKIKGIKFISKPSVKIYQGYKNLKPVKSGFGLGIITTSKGVLSYNEAKEQKLGGQVLFEIW